MGDRAGGAALEGLGGEIAAVVFGSAEGPEDLARLDLAAIGRQAAQRRGAGVLREAVREKSAADRLV